MTSGCTQGGAVALVLAVTRNSQHSFRLGTFFSSAGVVLLPGDSVQVVAWLLLATLTAASSTAGGVPLAENEVYPPPSPSQRLPHVPHVYNTSTMSVQMARQLSQVKDLRDFIINFVEDERICNTPNMRNIVVQGPDDRVGELWWYRRCSSVLKGGRFQPTSFKDELDESTLVKYRYPRKQPNPERRERKISSMSIKDQRKIDKLHKRSKCTPRVVPVPVPIDMKHPEISYFPHCVAVKRCGGCCSSNLLECIPTKTKKKKFKVMAIDNTSRSKYRVRNTLVTKRIEMHMECTCACRERQEHCKSYQKYDENNCRCYCPNETNCPPGKIWDSNECSCRCQNEAKCTTGAEFDHQNCRCLERK
ncbi:uncharacterized protein LOC143039362 isoform X2 [Oratosquilla oratoria]|uniref:uncharacterized protein LOC143039362 isoform X2 n=1 Tax=Oratosquilla oratoria TaxID=337810 RepID=UPI003F75F76C